MTNAPPASPRRFALILGVAALAALLIMRRAILPLGGLDLGDGDSLMMVWNLWHVDHAVSTLSNPLVTPLVYYPLGSGLAHHTYSPGLWPVAFLAKILSGHDPLFPVYAFHVCVLLAFTLAGALMFYLLLRIGASPLAATAPAILYAFSCYHRLHTSHLQLISAAWLLPALALVILRFAERPGPARAISVAAVIGGGLYFSEMIVYFSVAFALWTATLLLMRATRPRLLDVLARINLTTIAVFLVTLFLISWPFLCAWFSEENRPPRPEQSLYNSPNLLAFFVPDEKTTPLYGLTFARLNNSLRGIRGWETFLSFPLLLTGPLALRRSRAFALTVLIVAAIFFVLSLGPSLKVLQVNTEIPLPYRWFMAVPPFRMARTPVRLVEIVLFGLAILSAMGLEHLRERISTRRGRLAGRTLMATCLVWALAEVYSPSPRLNAYRVPAALARLAPGAVINVPISAFDSKALFFQTLHQRPIVTGYVSRRTRDQWVYLQGLTDLHDHNYAAFLASLRALGVGNILVNPNSAWDAPRIPQTDVAIVDLRE